MIAIIIMIMYTLGLVCLYLFGNLFEDKWKTLLLLVLPLVLIVHFIVLHCLGKYVLRGILYPYANYFIE